LLFCVVRDDVFWGQLWRKSESLEKAEKYLKLASLVWYSFEPRERERERERERKRET
jgi:hypothetical protein